MNSSDRLIFSLIFIILGISSASVGFAKAGSTVRFQVTNNRPNAVECRSSIIDHVTEVPGTITSTVDHSSRPTVTKVITFRSSSTKYIQPGETADFSHELLQPEVTGQVLKTTGQVACTEFLRTGVFSMGRVDFTAELTLQRNLFEWPYGFPAQRKTSFVKKKLSPSGHHLTVVNENTYELSDGSLYWLVNAMLTP